MVFVLFNLFVKNDEVKFVHKLFLQSQRFTQYKTPEGTLVFDME